MCGRFGNADRLQECRLCESRNRKTNVLDQKNRLLGASLIPEQPFMVQSGRVQCDELPFALSSRICTVPDAVKPDGSRARWGLRSWPKSAVSRVRTVMGETLGSETSNATSRCQRMTVSRRMIATRLAEVFAGDGQADERPHKMRVWQRKGARLGSSRCANPTEEWVGPSCVESGHSIWHPKGPGPTNRMS